MELAANLMQCKTDTNISLIWRFDSVVHEIQIAEDALYSVFKNDNSTAIATSYFLHFSCGIFCNEGLVHELNRV